MCKFKGGPKLTLEEAGKCLKLKLVLQWRAVWNLLEFHAGVLTALKAQTAVAQ